MKIFDGKKKNAISTSGFQDKWTFCILVLRFLKPVFKGILNTLYVFKAATCVE